MEALVGTTSNTSGSFDLPVEIAGFILILTSHGIY